MAKAHDKITKTKIQMKTKNTIKKGKLKILVNTIIVYEFYKIQY